MQAFMSSSLATGQLKRSSSVSSAHSPALSLWVVITESAPKAEATRCVNSLAPPTWPDKTETAWLPILSTQITAGSVCLSSMSDAIVRTQMPIAPIKMKASKSFHRLDTSARLMIEAWNSCWRVSARWRPSSLIGMMAIFCISVFRLGCCRLG